MPCPSHKPYTPMTIIRPNVKPSLWWLFPWSYARTLHTAANALRALTDRQEEAIRLQAHIIVDQSEEIANLRRRVEDLSKPTNWQPLVTAPKHGGSFYVRATMYYSKDSEGWAYFQDPKTTAEWMHIPAMEVQS